MSKDQAQKQIKAGIMGASGVTGTELASILAQHPHVDIAFATSREYENRSLRQVDPAAPDITLQHPDKVSFDAVDVVFRFLPHWQSGAAAAAIESKVKSIHDL